ncbi:phosphatase PAP2 family protein [Actinomadura roseirufa]|uniref:phosphatase PAP2 family protein n=1 Tax=Actinomadura roseirufa TaxID=2094049 RepID=UPI001F5E38F2|nr:phosphatase PAP2 family protein [Actinomadura roseirufa]
MAQIAPPAALRRRADPARHGASRQPAATTRRRVLTAPPVWRELMLIVLFYTGYTLTRIVLVQDGTGGAFAHAGDVLRLERFLGIDSELGLNQMLLNVPWLARTANIFYATMHFIVTIGVVVWLYRYRPQEYRWLRTSIMVATGIALLGFWLYPLAPPRFLHSEGFVDPVTALHSLGLYASDASGSLTNQYAAMPSMHAGWALWCGFIMVKLTTRRWAKLLGVLYPATTVFVILSTANHYVLDAVAGMALIGGALGLSWLLYTRCPRWILDARSRLRRRLTHRPERSSGAARRESVPAGRASESRI